MDRFEVRNVESPKYWGVDQLRYAPVCPARFETFQKFRVSDPAKVLEDVCAGI